MWDCIVIGSGIAGLSAAAALAQRGQRVLLLEQHSVAGGLTQTFSRRHWRFSTGLHYLSGVAPGSGADGQLGRLLHGLSGGALQFADCGNPYDIVRLPGFEFGIEHPQSAYRAALHERFPAHTVAIDGWFDEIDASRKAAFSLFALRALPPWLAWGLRLWRGAEVRRCAERTLAEALAGIADPQLRAVLGARWGDHGAPPASAPLLEHALVTAAYDGGAGYPVGGPERIAQTLVATLEAGGGELRLGADVRRIEVRDGHVAGVVFERDGERRCESARHVVSTMGVANTVACLDADVAPAWQATVRALRPGLSYLALYIGFDGDIAAAGASAANVWVYESEDVGRVWAEPADEPAPGFFVSFPSLKDPAHPGGRDSGHTAELVAMCDARAFSPWLELPADRESEFEWPEGERPEDYLALKAWIEEMLLAQFKRHFPALAPMIAFHELSTPVTQRHYVRSPDGAAYGIEMSADRLASDALNVRTPVPGLLLAGQDVSGPGIQAACIGGLMAAATLQPALLRQLGS